jgi:glycosyltransferase involved in cell wall biosynthesis
MHKIAIIGTNGLPGRYGGWDQLLNHLTIILSKKYEIIVYTSKYNAIPGLKEFNNSKIRVLPLKANGIQSIFYDGYSMFESSLKCDILLVLGTSGCIFLPFIKLFNSNIVLNPDGAEWKRGKWNFFVQQFLKLSEYLGVKFAKVVVSDNLIIKNHVFNFYSKKSTLIEYGGDHVLSNELTNETQIRYKISQGSYAFKVCRIEPENNIDLILKVFSQVKLRFILIGNWNNSSYGINTRDKYKSYCNLTLLDPIYDQEKLDELRSNCGLYIHGHSVGGTNPSLVEAMYLGLNCVVFDVDYNRVTTEDKAIYFKDGAELLKIVSEFENDSSGFYCVGESLKRVASIKYKWVDIVNKYDRIFNNILE